MKRIGCLLLALGMVLLCACGYMRDVVGVWKGTGDMSMVGVKAPAEAEKTLTFTRDEKLTVLVELPDGTTYEVEYAYYYVTDDTMTFGLERGGYGVRYSVQGNLLRIGDGNGGSNTFVKLK